MKTVRPIRGLLVPALFVGSPVGTMLLFALFAAGVPAGAAMAVAYVVSTASAVAVLHSI